MSLFPRATGIAAAVVTVAIWTGFIIIGRASAAHTLLPFDIALMRVLGASAVLLPWGWWLTRGRARRPHPDAHLGQHGALAIVQTGRHS